ncbi:hypothetical protein DPMN_031312 [Dreissena polymorpha]|uniref:Uncharacterized protein n=1 Tax=Dreissena polymorpha TaxID=45954 RepID=A0A9D4RIY8_DREPO|nr:hypothetical protein DPMN_031312 [Dreissena polymorpha]
MPHVAGAAPYQPAQKCWLVERNPVRYILRFADSLEDRIATDLIVRLRRLNWNYASRMWNKNNLIMTRLTYNMQ